MTDDEIDCFLETLVEELAAPEHERWAHWQRYLHRQGQRQADGSLVLPPALVSQWERQISTTYADLSSLEKDCDRQQVRRYLPILVAALGRARLVHKDLVSTVEGLRVRSDPETG